MRTIINRLQQEFPDLNFKSQYPLRKQTYFKIGGQAEVYLELSQKKEIIEVISFCRNNHIKFTILGGASNVFIDEDGISGLVLHLKNNGFHELKQTIDQDKQLIKVGAGLKTALLVKKTTALGYTGLEFFLGVPGTVGGAVFNNAHYLEELISAYIYQVEVLNSAGEIKTVSHDECEFKYDYSRFQQTQEIILEVTFALKKGDAEESLALIKKATQYRADTQPLGLPSSGCIFKNTPNSEQLKKIFPQFKDRQFISAGFLIDQAGLKGVKVGGIEVSTKHAAFFVNNGDGTADDLKKLIKVVKKAVKNKFDLTLEQEVFYLS